MESPRARNDTKAPPVTVAHAIRNFTTSEEDFNSIWHMWQTIFPAWPIERPRLEKILHQLPGHHYIHGKGFCLSYLKDGTHGKIAAIGVFPDSRGQGIGTALMERARDGLESESGGELKALEIGSQAPRFWPQMPVDFPQEVKDFFLQRGTLVLNRSFWSRIELIISIQDSTNHQTQQSKISTKTSATLSHLPRSWTASPKRPSYSRPGLQN